MYDTELELICLEKILSFEMTSREAKAYKICIIYQHLLHKLFPNERHYKRQRKGDPRKTTLFKYCFKLLRETERMLEDHEYELYIRAQMDTIKAITKRAGANSPDAFISPVMLVGEKAWKRWKLWERLYKKQLKRKEAIECLTTDPVMNEKVKIALRADQRFLDKNLKGLTKETIRSALDSRILLRWIAAGPITPYYALLSPILRDWLIERKLEIGDIFHIDFGFYQPAISDQIKQFFREEYSYEF